ncbi:MAG: hypothetical protein JNL42_09540 [Anaerolineae bacterium]|nr:hypothetical protein [Anaerolineae bacterium]
MNDIRRVMLMVAALHKLGYERIRLAPAMSPSGMHWRGNVTSIQNILRTHGAAIQNYSEDLVARHSTGQGPQVYGWADAETDSPDQLAHKFIERFPLIAVSGQGSDPAYVDWYRDMLAATEPDGFIYAFADWEVPDDQMPTLNVSELIVIPMPPPGEADG